MTRRKQMFALLVALSVLCFSSCAPAKASAQGSRIRLGFLKNVTHATALVGIERGTFANALGPDVSLETKPMANGALVVEALFGDALDIAYLGPIPSLNAYEKSHGKAIRILSGATSGGAFFIVQPEITGVKQLIGQKVASPQLATTQDIALRSWLHDQGSGGGDVSVVPQDTSEILQAFRQRLIAGAWVAEPWASRLQAEAGGKVLVDERSLWPDGRYVTTQLVVSQKFLGEHPDLVEKFLQGHVDVTDFLSQHPDDAKRSLAGALKNILKKPLPDAIINQSWQSMSFTNDPLPNVTKKNADHMISLGFIKEFHLDGIYDVTLLNNVLRSRGKAELYAR
jgi:NitT/TauT family transport system substrate-binding protein